MTIQSLDKNWTGLGAILNLVRLHHPRAKLKPPDRF